ncbi:MAG: nodulation protein NfeD [Phycisphaerae bacterium]
MNRRRHGRSETANGSPQRRIVGCGFVLAGLCAWAAPLIGQEPPPATKAVVIPIKGEINDVLRRSIERRLDEARADGFDLVVFEMDTRGGLVTSALDISKLIKRLPDENIRTVAWVNDQAYSAGALISVAAQEILMSSTASIGDCAPIMISPIGGMEQLGETERAKAESPILQEFRDSAVRNGYDHLLCRAMVTVGIEVWWVENKQTGERKFVDGSDKKQLIDDVDAEQREWQVVKTYRDPRFDKEVPAKTPTDEEGELLTLSEGEAVAYGFANAIAADLQQVAAQLGLAAALKRIDTSGWENFAMWLNSPLVRGILFVIMLLGAYIEFQSPGLIVPGVTALVALGIFLGAPYAAGLADIWTIILLVVGLVLLAVEIFVLPGFGVAGILGVVLILVAFLGSFVPAEPGAPPFSWPSLDSTWTAIQTGILVLSSSVIIAVTGIALLARYLPSMPFGRRLVLANPQDADALAISDPHPNVALVGDIGIVTGDLRPGGQARFGQEIVDVQSQGEYVDAGRSVQVIVHDGPKVVVRPLPDEA